MYGFRSYTKMMEGLAILGIEILDFNPLQVELQIADGDKRWFDFGEADDFLEWAVE